MGDGGLKMTSVRKQQVSRVIPLLIIIFSLSFPAYAKYSGGAGEPNDPYQIATAEDLMMLGETPEDYDKHFIMTADIDLDPNLPGRKVFDRAVIGTFTGVFDGNGHTISNLTIDGRDYSLGLFGYTESGADIRGVGVIDVNIIGTYDYVGGLVGRNDGNIAASYSTGSVKGRLAVGGLVGDNHGTITMSHSIASVGGYEWVGGLAGFNYGGINSSYSIVAVSGDWSVGGLVGYNSGGSIIGCYSSGSVSGQSRIGGLLGENGEGSSIVASYSNASVSGGNDVGGLVGDNTYGSITSCYSSGSVSGAAQVGGLVGNGGDLDIAGDKIRGDTSASFWDSQSSGQAVSSGGTGLTTTEMQDVKTFLGAGWDYVDEVNNGVCDFWQMSPNDYPRLRYIDGDGPLMPEGMGTSEQPYLIRNAQDLGIVWFKPMAHYSLAQSIDLSGITWSTAAVPWFGGNFDGNSYTISQLHIEGGSYLGLFGQLALEGSVCNLDMEETKVDGTNKYIGGLVGYGSFEGIVNTGITHCSSSGSVNGESCVGGLLGYNGGSITRSHASALVVGISDIGGLVGCNARSIATSYSSGSVIGTYGVGGLVGLNYYGNINNSYSSGSVNGNGSVGGLVGRDFRGRITKSYSKASVIGNTLVGGLVGSSFHDVVFPGVFDDSLYCFWDIEASSQTKSRWGIGKTTTEMQTASTFLEAGWDFVDEMVNGTKNIWWIDEGKDYPRLSWELVWFSDYMPRDPNEYGIKTFEWVYGQAGEYTSRIDGSETVPYLSGPITGTQMIENNNTLVGTNDGLNVSFLASGEWILSTDPNLMAHPTAWTFAGLYDDMIIDQGVWYLVKKDMSEWQAVDNQQLLIDIQDITVPEGHHNKAVIFWYLDTAYSFTPLDFHGNESDLGITLPSNSQTASYSVTGFDIFAVNTGVIAHGDIDAATGYLNDLAVLKQID
jgi:hypothetical protein